MYSFVIVSDAVENYMLLSNSQLVLVGKFWYGGVAKKEVYVFPYSLQM